MTEIYEAAPQGAFAAWEISSVYLAIFAMVEAEFPSLAATYNETDLDRKSLNLQMAEFAFGGFYWLSLVLFQVKKSSRDIISLSNLGDPVAAMALLFLAIDFIELLDLVNGLGAPDTGGDFRDGATAFGKNISIIVAEAFPGDNWTGDAAETYRSKNQNHLNHLENVGRADRKIASITNAQAAAVEVGHELLESASLILSVAVMLLTPIYACWYLLEKRSGFASTAEDLAEDFSQLPADLGRLMVNFVRAAVLAAGLIALGAISYLIDEGKGSRQAINDAKAAYGSVARYWLMLLP
ncbi:MAG: hypothetical protein K2Q25_09995 [Mycobacteriaceae bacterium]|nr:hypothetical protein [Mycobacteriaceae bacterium]